MAYFTAVKSPKSIASPVVANSIYSMVLTSPGARPPDITPLVDDEVPFDILLAAPKLPKSC